MTDLNDKIRIAVDALRQIDTRFTSPSDIERLAGNAVLERWPDTGIGDLWEIVMSAEKRMPKKWWHLEVTWPTYAPNYRGPRY